MGKRFLHTRSQRTGTPVLSAAGVLAITLLGLALPSAAGRLGSGGGVSNVRPDPVTVMDVPYVPAQSTAIVLAQAVASSAGSSTLQPDYLLNVCKETELTLNPESALRGVDPIGWIATQLNNRYGTYIDPAKLATAKLTMLEDTKHGRLVPKIAGNGQPYYMYEAKPDYVGKDRAVFAVELEGKRYKVVVDLRVLEIVDENSPVCGRPQLIKVTKPVSDGSDYYRLNSYSVTFGSLDGGEVGRYTGSTIALYADAATLDFWLRSVQLHNISA